MCIRDSYLGCEAKRSPHGLSRRFPVRKQSMLWFHAQLRILYKYLIRPSCTVARKSIHRLSRESTRTLSPITARLGRRHPTHPSLPYQPCALCGFLGLPLQEPVLRTLSRDYHIPNCTITRYMCISRTIINILLLGSPS